MTKSRQSEFADAMLAHLPALRRYATALVGNAAAADDLTQDCIEQALRKWTKLKEIERIGGWLRKILHNLYIDDLRRKGRQGSTVEIGIADELGLIAPSNERTEMIDFHRAFKTLSLEHRQVLLLVGLEGLTYSEISEEIDVPVGTVMSRIARARDQLRNRIAGGASQHNGAEP